MPTIAPQTDVLIGTDIQNDFMPGGALAVPQGDARRALHDMDAVGVRQIQVAQIAA